MTSNTSDRDKPIPCLSSGGSKRGKGGPLKLFLRRFMRWYVEPAFADQRAFNDAVLKLIDDLDERIARLEQR